MTITSLSNFPESIRKQWECRLLHKKTVVWDGKYIELDGEIYKEMKYICKECNHDNDTAKNKEAAQPSESANRIYQRSSARKRTFK